MARGGLIIFVCAAFAAGAALADGEIKLSAGEHSDYSRIVIPGGATDVFVDNAARTVDIRFASGDPIVDLSDVNGKHKAYRVVGARKIVDSNGAFVRLTLNCDCLVASTQLASGKLVVDIADAKPIAAAAEEPAPQEAEASPGGDDVSVEEARSRMRDLLQRAANEGFITMRGADPAPADAPLPKAAPPVKVDAPTLKAPPPPPPPEPVATADCQPDSAFAIDGGRFDEDPLGAIAEFRAALDEAPELKRNAVADDFARGYLAIGFGEEALALLADRGEKDSLLADMARVVAERPLSNSGPLMGALECNGAHALWQAAAAEPERAAKAAEGFADALSALPKRLRTLLAARIAKKLIDAGAWSEANTVYRIAGEHSEYAEDDLRYVAARLLDHEGEGGEGEELLRDVASGASEASQDALLALAARYAAEGGAPEGLIEDLGALATTAKGSPIGGEAALHEGLIWIAGGNIEAGVFLLRSAAESSEGLAAKASAEAGRAIGEAFASDDPAHRLAALRAFVEYRTFVERAGPAPEMRAKAAETAVEVGLPNLALRLLGSDADSGDRARALLKARAALAADQPEPALASAAPYADDPEFAAIVVKANLQLDRNYAALAAASAAPEGPAKAEMMALAAWRAGDYASAARAYGKVDPTKLSVEDAVHYALSAYMAGEADMPPAAEAVLSRDDKASLDGLKSLFAKGQDGPVVERGKALAESAAGEITFIRELLGHG